MHELPFLDDPNERSAVATAGVDALAAEADDSVLSDPANERVGRVARIATKGGGGRLGSACLRPAREVALCRSAILDPLMRALLVVVAEAVEERLELGEIGSRALVGERQRLEEAIRTIDTEVGWRESLERRQIEIGRIEEQITRLRKEIEERRLGQISRDELLETLTGRFRAILGDFSFPKLDDPRPPYLDKNFSPHVREVNYRDIGSAGAMTLIALAWQLAMSNSPSKRAIPTLGS